MKAFPNSPAWLPKTYRIGHPRFSYPDADWLAKAKGDPKALGTLGKVEQLVIRQRLNPTPAGAQALSDFIAREEPFNPSYWADMYSLGVLYDWGCDLLSPEDRRCLLFRLKRLCAYTEPSGTTLNAPGNGISQAQLASLSNSALAGLGTTDTAPALLVNISNCLNLK